MKRLKILNSNFVSSLHATFTIQNRSVLCSYIGSLVYGFVNKTLHNTEKSEKGATVVTAESFRMWVRLLPKAVIYRKGIDDNIQIGLARLCVIAYTVYDIYFFGALVWNRRG